MSELATTRTPTGAMNALTLRMQDEMFAIEAGHVREILDMVPITVVPNAPAFVTGLINVRGRVVPLADMRVMFDMARPPADADTLRRAAKAARGKRSARHA